MNTLLAFISPKKQPPAPPPPEEHKPHIKSKTYSKKDRIRARHALQRISNASDTRSERSRRSDVSVVTRDKTPEPVASQQEDVDIYDATPRSTRSQKKNQPDPASPTPKRRAKDVDTKDPYEFTADDLDSDAESGGEQCGFKRFADHRWDGDALELKVEWDHGSPTWEPERNLHRDAPKALFEYWRKQGGRPLNPRDPDLYDIYAIRKHSRNKAKLLVEWTGFDEKNMTWMPRRVVEETAKDAVEEYWKDLRKKQKMKKRAKA